MFLDAKCVRLALESMTQRTAFLSLVQPPLDAESSAAKKTPRESVDRKTLCQNRYVISKIVSRIKKREACSITLHAVVHRLLRFRSRRTIRICPQSIDESNRRSYGIVQVLFESSAARFTRNKIMVAIFEPMHSNLSRKPNRRDFLSSTERIPCALKN